MDRDEAASIKLNIANIVASGKLNLELELEAVAHDLCGVGQIADVKHTYGHGNRIVIHFKNNPTTAMVISSGVYILTGAKSDEQAESAKALLFESLSELGILSDSTPRDDEEVDSFVVQNRVYTAVLTDFQSLDLTTIAVGLGLEKTEYEPEQFPGLVYRPDTDNCTILLFSSGKAVITGVKYEEEAWKAIRKLHKNLRELLK